MNDVKKPAKKAAEARLTPKARIESMITGLLGAPRGDPDPHHKLAAAHCCLLLEQLGHEPDPEVVRDLSSDDRDYIQLAREDACL